MAEELEESRAAALERRVAALEEQVRRLTDGATPGQRSDPQPPPPPPPPPPTPPAPPAPSDPGPTRPTPLTLRSETLLRWGGVLLVVLAVTFAVSTAIDRGWIGPRAQLVGAVGVSLALATAGWRLRRTRMRWAHALCTGGVLAAFSTAASTLFLDETSRSTAFAATVLVAAAALALADRLPSGWVAGTATTAGAIAWATIADGDAPFNVTLVFLTALGTAALATATVRRWHGARLVTHLVMLGAVTVMAVDADTVAREVVVLTLAAALALSLAVLPDRGDPDATARRVEVQLTMAVGPWLVLVATIALELDRRTTAGLAGLVVAAALAALSVGVRRLLAPPSFVSVVASTSATLTIALITLIGGSGALAAVAVQGAGLVFLAAVIEPGRRVLANAAIVLGVTTLVAVGAMIDALDIDAPLGTDLAHVVVILAVAVAGVAVHRRFIAITAEAVGATVVVLGLLWLASVLVHLPQGQLLVSIAWAVTGTILLVGGARTRRTLVAGGGLAVLGLTAAKLLTVDLRAVDTLWRAGLFFVVGLGFLRLGFLLPELERRGGQASGESDG